VSAEDAERLAVWRSWLDKESMSNDWDRNLWDEFYGLFFRRATGQLPRDVLRVRQKMSGLLLLQRDSG
jgi:hypothetical protein